MITIKIEGLSELDRRLREFGPKIAANGLRAANFAAARVFREAAKQEAPVRTGLLRANIIASKRRTPKNVAMHTIRLSTKAKKYENTAQNRRLRRVGKKYRVEGPAFYGRFIEFGFHTRDGRFIPPNPFLRRAFVNNYRQAIDADRDRLARAVELAAKR